MAEKPPVNEVTKNLSGVDFPAKKEDLVAHAKDQGANDDVVQAIEDLPQNEFRTMADVMKAFGQED